VSIESQLTAQSVIRTFLTDQLGRADIAVDDELFPSGFLNSLLAMQLIALLEKSFAIRIEDEDLDIANFSSIACMTNLVNRKRAS